MDRPNLPIRRRVRLYRCAGHRQREDQRHQPEAGRVVDATDGQSPSSRKPVEVRIRPAGKTYPDKT